MIIDRREETIHKTNKTPRNVERDCYWKKNDTANNASYIMKRNYKMCPLFYGTSMQSVWS